MAARAVRRQTRGQTRGRARARWVTEVTLVQVPRLYGNASDVFRKINLGLKTEVVLCLFVCFFVPTDVVSVFSIVVYTGDETEFATDDPVYATVYGEHGQCEETLVGTSPTHNT